MRPHPGQQFTRGKGFGEIVVGSHLEPADDRFFSRSRMDPVPLPDQLPPPEPCGPHLVQTLRTYPAMRPPYSFAKLGEQSIARGYSKAIKRARRLIYLEDQYLWSVDATRAQIVRAARGLLLA